MAKLIKVSINISGMIGVKEMFSDKVISDYSHSKPITRSMAGTMKQLTVFNSMETMLSLPEFTIHRMSFITCYNSRYIGTTAVDSIPTIEEANATRYLGVRKFEEECHHLIIVLDLRDGFTDMKDFSFDTYNDGFIGALLQDGPSEMNSFAQNVIARYSKSLTPEGLIAMEGVRKDFANYVIMKRGSFIPESVDILEFAQKHGSQNKWVTRALGGQSYYNLADRAGLLTLSDSDFKSWALETSQRNAARIVAVNLMKSIEFEAGTALYDVGYVASEGIAYEIMGYLCALILI